MALLASDVEQQFQSQLSRSSIPLGVKKLDEVEVVECDTATKPFSSELTLGLSITSNISGNILDSVADLVESVYNELIEDYCDPLIRRIQSLKISNYEPSELIGFQNVQLTFGIDGVCQGCDDDVPQWDQENNDKKSKRRVMQSTVEYRATTHARVTQKLYSAFLCIHLFSHAILIIYTAHCYDNIH